MPYTYSKAQARTFGSIRQHDAQSSHEGGRLSSSSGSSSSTPTRTHTRVAPDTKGEHGLGAHHDTVPAAGHARSLATQHGGHPGGAASLSASVPCRSRARKIRYCMRSAATWSINRVRGPGVRLDSPRHNSGPYRPEPQRAARPRSTLERALGRPSSYTMAFCFALLSHKPSPSAVLEDSGLKPLSQANNFLA